jgi:ubiquinone/menaquinone biosynthesis C-methylase UbiE
VISDIRRKPLRALGTDNKFVDVGFPGDALYSEECERILAEYERRSHQVENSLYAPWYPAQSFIRAGRERAALQLLRRARIFPRAGDKCLEVGYGKLGWLGTLISWGLREEDLSGIELDRTRASIAREVLPVADLRVGNATALPWEDGTFKLVVVSTVFTSILQVEMRQSVAKEIIRVLEPGGAVLWYDFAFNNPRNPNVRKVNRQEILSLFKELEGRIIKVTLAPPLARFVASRSWLLATILEALPILRTHLLGLLVKKQLEQA